MKVIIEIEYNPSEWTIIWLFNLLKKIYVKYKVFKIEPQIATGDEKKIRNIYYSIAFIKKVTCLTTGMTEDKLESKSRKQEVVENRQIAMYLSRIYTRKSFREIGYEFGNKTPATIMHACKAITNLYETDRKFQTKLTNIENQLNKAN